MNEYDFSNAWQGPLVQPLPAKTQITIRIDTCILDWFRSKVYEAGGGNYQTFINEALQEYIHNYDEKLESTIQEELQTIAK